MITFSSKGQIKKKILTTKVCLEYSFGIWQGPLNLIVYFERQSSNMPVCFEIWALTDIDKAQVWCIWCVLQYLTSQWYFDLVNPVWFPEVFSISSPFLKRKKKAHTHLHLIFTEFYFIMLQTMTSRYIDTQLLLCVYVHLWVYVCVKRAVRPQKAEWKSRVREPSMG